jgi:hypothetical protein
MTKAEEFFIELINEIPGVKPGKMFGSLCMKTSNGKSAAMFWKDNIVVKLQGELLNEAMKFGGAQLFEPMEGRTMKEWVQIPFAHKEVWKKFALLSSQSVNSLTNKQPTRKKILTRNIKSSVRICS